MDALKYDAPFLIEKLLKDHIVDTEEEALTLFVELKRWLILVQTHNTMRWDMYSLRIDEVWHQFVLFTKEYTQFCEQFFDNYVAHVPSNAPERIVGVSEPKRISASFEDFQTHYNDLFGSQPPSIWDDSTGLTVHRRVINYHVGNLIIRNDGEKVLLVYEDDMTLISVGKFAHDALVFISETGAFYIRELPGDLKDEEKIAIAGSLVKCRVLRVAS